jgi:hypothetical protein
MPSSNESEERGIEIETLNLSLGLKIPVVYKRTVHQLSTYLDKRETRYFNPAILYLQSSCKSAKARGRLRPEGKAMDVKPRDRIPNG